jgi:AraC-like DNA-binding protein
MIHSVSPGFRYRLNGGSASIVARQASYSSQEVILPVQNNLDLLILQIDTKRYAGNINPDLLNIPAELAAVFMNKSKIEYFFYHSIFSLSIYETLKEVDEVHAEGLVKRFFIESKALELLWMQTENYKNEQLYGYDRFLLRKTDLELLGKAREFVRINLETNLTLKSVARGVGTNETKLKNGLKALYGKTFGEILRNDRLTKARLILEEGSLNIKETAAKCGYTSAGVFSRRFKEKYGVLPGVYLKSK